MSEGEKEAEVLAENLKEEDNEIKDSGDTPLESAEEPVEQAIEEGKEPEKQPGEAFADEEDAEVKLEEAEANGEEPEVQASTIKQYQQILQELKEEIARLTKKLDQKSKESNFQPSEEELFKLKCMCKYAKQEVKDLNEKLEEVNKTSAKAEANVEHLHANSYDDETSIEKVEDLNKKLKELEEEYSELLKSSSEINISDLDKILVPEPNPKLVNEFFVNVQKRLTSLDNENSALSAQLKKNTIEVNKLKEKCENAASRYRSNDELKNKLRDLEETFAKYSMIEQRLMQDLKQAEEEYAIHNQRPENKHDNSSAQKMLDDLEMAAKKDKEEIEQLEFVLQEKRNLLRAARAYGLQRSKTSNKLRSDMELLGLVLVEKDQMISKLKKEVEEIKWKQVQVEMEIKEITMKNDYRSSE